MKVTLLIAAVLTILIPSAVSATTLDWEKATVGGTTTYTYNLECSDEFGFAITSLHIYAPISPELISSGWNNRGWSFAVDPDTETGGADIYWYCLDPGTQALPENESMTLSMAAPSWTTTVTDFEIPGTFGNWGYETELFEGYVLVSFPSVGVPCGTAPAAPEPASLAGIVTGIGLLCGMRRRRAAKS